VLKHRLASEMDRNATLLNYLHWHLQGSGFLQKSTVTNSGEKNVGRSLSFS